MLSNAIGLIFADHKRIQLGELSRPRALASMPFAGRYRIIDFMLSNMVNSGITSVGVITLHKYKSLMDHLGTGSSWDLDRKNKGLSLLPPFINSLNVMDSCETDDLSGLLDFFRNNRPGYVVLANSNVIFNTVFNDYIARHSESGADISVMYNRDGLKFGQTDAVLRLDKNDRVNDVLFGPAKPPSNRCSIGVMIADRDLLIDLLNEAIARGERDFSIEYLLRQHKELKIAGIEYRDTLLRINDIQTYFSSSLSILNDHIRDDLFWSGLPVYTKVKDEAPARYSAKTKVSNSLISDGCLINGSVSNSILFRGVVVSEHAKIRNSIIMQDSFISEGVHLENAILDKNCVVRPGIKLVGQKGFPIVIGKGAIV